jgi:hypothetical protein
MVRTVAKPEPLPRWIERVVRLPAGAAAEPGPIKLYAYQKGTAAAIADRGGRAGEGAEVYDDETGVATPPSYAREELGVAATPISATRAPKEWRRGIASACGSFLFAADRGRRLPAFR